MRISSWKTDGCYARDDCPWSWKYLGFFSRLETSLIFKLQNLLKRPFKKKIFIGSMPITSSFGRSSVSAASGVRSTMCNIYAGYLFSLAKTR